MADIKKLIGEEVIASSGDDTIILTNYRIRLHKYFEVKSIMLEHIAGIEITYTSYPWLSIIGGLVLLGSLIGGALSEEPGLFGVAILGIVLIGIYYLLRKHSIVISSDGKSSISFITKGMPREKVLDFVNQVEQAIVDRKKSHNVTYSSKEYAEN